jgi:hypothetical protein
MVKATGNCALSDDAGAVVPDVADAFNHRQNSQPLGQAV